MTVLAEEVAALRRAVAAQAVMLKEVMGAVERPHDTLKELNLRLQVLESWQLGANAALNEMNTPPTPLPRYPTYVPANDNDPSKAFVQKLKLLDEIDAFLKGHMRLDPTHVGFDIWMLLTDLQAVLDQHRRSCHG